MKILEKEIIVDQLTDIWNLYPIGDVHIGAFNCAESHLKNYINHIASDPRGLWIGGGDYCDCITPQDAKRFDVSSLPDWILTGGPMTIREQLTDITKQERDRFCEMVEPIKDKCIGLMQGNHEYALMKLANNGHHFLMCEELGVPNLTDAVMLRLNFRKIKKPHSSGVSVVVFAVHGHGGGRTAGAEPNHLARLRNMADADIYLRGHSHTFHIAPTEIKVCIPRKGSLPDELMQRELYSANWGCWVKSYASGPPTYDSRATYPPRPLRALQVEIKPQHNAYMRVLGRPVTKTQPRIRITECYCD